MCSESCSISAPGATFPPPNAFGCSIESTVQGDTSNPEDFCAIWYRGETYLWLLLPLLFAMGYFLLTVPFWMKLSWLCLLVSYSFLWSVVRLALALATFHYFGSLWMPLFYFVFGFLADFLYIVAFYSLAMDRAAVFLVKQKEVWQ